MKWLLTKSFKKDKLLNLFDMLDSYTFLEWQITWSFDICQTYCKYILRKWGYNNLFSIVKAGLFLYNLLFYEINHKQKWFLHPTLLFCLFVIPIDTLSLENYLKFWLHDSGTDREHIHVLMPSSNGQFSFCSHFLIVYNHKPITMINPSQSLIGI